MEIREARTDDAAAVAALLGELGYPTSEEQVAFRLERLARSRRRSCSSSASSNGRGIGARLLDALEAEATSRGCLAVALTSGNHRHEAHAFYERRGYEATSKRFAKGLSNFNQMS